jgi:radical SAM-linked protein
LPWDHINIGVDRSFLIEEKARALVGKITEDCRTGFCSGCGVCNFDSIKPVSFHDQKRPFSKVTPDVKPESSETSVRYLVEFKKMKSSRFLGHLEMVKIFIRSLRREQIPLRYSNGFHPMPKISFRDTLPMGMQSEDEQMLVTLTEAIDPGELVLRLRRQMPEGLEITRCYPYVSKTASDLIEKQHYQVELKDGFFMQKDLDWFYRQQSVNIERKSKKGRKIVVDLKKAASEIRLLDSRHVVMILGKDNNRMVRPKHVMRTVFNLSERQILTAIITKRKMNHV